MNTGAGSRSAGGPSTENARQLALDLLVSWERERSIFIEHLLHRALERATLSTSDAAFVAQLCYGIVRHRNTLKHLSEHYCHRDLREVPRTLRMALTLGLFQLIYLRTPAHAAVFETVSAWDALLARRDVRSGRRESGRSFLNGTLRTVARGLVFSDGEADADAADTIRTPGGWVRIPKLKLAAPQFNRHESLAIKYSHPPEMVRLWLERLGKERLRRFLEHNNRPPRLYLVLRDGDSEAYCRKLEDMGLEGEPVDGARMVVLDSGTVPRLPGYQSGDFWVQDLTAHRLVERLPHRAGASLLDLCAAPGGKLATLLTRGEHSSVMACDVSEERLRLLAENLHRLRFPMEGIQVVEAPQDPARLRLPSHFDQVLVDAPCSNTGVLARRHEARWRLIPENLRDLVRVQQGLLEAGRRHLAPGGDLLYLTCSIEPAENSEQIHSLIRRCPELMLVQEEEYIPGDDAGGDGGYAALLKKR